MNIINKFFLKLALLPVGLYKRMGVNIHQLKSILHTKLTMDDRRPNTLHQTQRRKNKPVSMATLGTMVMSALLGLIYLFAFSIGSNVITNLTIYFSLFFFMLSASLISDFTSVLIDVRDTFIILPKPVSDKTVVVARLLHIFIHICKMVLPMSLAGFVYITTHYGIAGSLFFLVMIAFVTSFAIFFINALYILILRITTPQKFQSIISYVQIIFAIAIYASYQVFPRMIGDANLGSLDISSKPLIILYPIYWFACCWNVLYYMAGSSNEIIAAVLGLVLPVLSLYFVVKYLAPTFNNKLAMISSSSSEQAAVVKKGQRRASYSDFLAKLFTSSAAEKMGFLFTWKMAARSRDFKLKVYPSIGYLAVYVVIMFMNSKTMSLDQVREEGTRGKVLIISALYFTSLLLTMAINQMIYSDKYKASWVYYVSPLQKPGEIIMGGAKAAIFKFYIPIVVFITLAGLSLVGPKILPNIILGLFNELLIATVVVYVSNKMFPFSVYQNTNVKAGSFLRSLFVLFISGLIAVGHFFIYSVIPVVLICAVLSVVATWMMMGSIKNTSWAAIKSRYAEE